MSRTDGGHLSTQMDEVSSPTIYPFKTGLISGGPYVSRTRSELAFGRHCLAPRFLRIIGQRTTRLKPQHGPYIPPYVDKMGRRCYE